MISEHFFPDRDSMFVALLKDCTTIMRTATEQKERATLLVSGGSTPMPLYQKLSEVELAWSKVCIALVDERWVDVDHAGSNAASIHKNLLQNRASEATFVALKTTQKTAVLGQSLCEQAYRQLPRPFDLTILGMGPDGHTASLFPAAQGLEAALDARNKDLCAAITANPSEVTGELTERLSLTLSGLLQSRQLHLLITGADKFSVYQRALASSDEMLMPVSAILHQNKIPIMVYWAP
ncbi:MAG: 6-phosphogluconolactonase [Gammaproteobacteria bacterium]|nr:6-phosphogluconolactonase [Gammaproteobacteria bacterium]